MKTGKIVNVKKSPEQQHCLRPKYYGQLASYNYLFLK